VKVFISWSGEQSQAAAIALRDWLPNVIQAIRPYLSSEDIDKGARWSTDIAQELEDSSFGILCITRENISAPWVNFEAGALSKSLEQSRVAPFLIDINRTDVTGPLLQFQSTIAEREDVRKLVGSLNQACGDHGLEEGRLDEIFNVWWPRLEEKLHTIQAAEPNRQDTTRSTQEVLSEVLELVRGQHKLLSDPEALLPPEYVDFALRRARLRPSPAAIRDLDRAFHRLQEAINSRIDMGEEVPHEFVEVLNDLEPPTRHLVRQARSVPSSRRSRAAADLDLEDQET
jgi:hypothetical protein